MGNKNIAGILGNIGGVISTAINNKTQRDIAADSNAFNYQMFQEANAFNASEAEKQRQWVESQYQAHESLSAKVAEAQEAGVNPYAVLGDSAGLSVGSGSAASSNAAPNAVTPQVNADYISKMLSNKLLEKEIEGKDINNQYQAKELGVFDERFNLEVREFNDKHSMNEQTLATLSAQCDNMIAQAETEKWRAKVTEARAAIERYNETMAKFDAETQRELYDIATECQALDNKLKTIHVETEREQIEAEIRTKNAAIAQRWAEVGIGTKNAETSARNAKVNEYNAQTARGNALENAEWHKVLDANADLDRAVQLIGQKPAPGAAWRHADAAAAGYNDIYSGKGYRNNPYSWSEGYKGKTITYPKH